jgi:hypothetical protein
MDNKISAKITIELRPIVAAAPRARLASSTGANFTPPLKSLAIGL